MPYVHPSVYQDLIYNEKTTLHLLENILRVAKEGISNMQGCLQDDAHQRACDAFDTIAAFATQGIPEIEHDKSTDLAQALPSPHP